MSDVEATLRERTRELAARIKELNCLYRTSDLLQREPLDFEVKLRQIPGLLLSGLRFPEIARVLLEVDERTYGVDWNQERGPVCREPVRAEDRVIGALSVAYGPDDTGPALSPDERALVHAVATRTGAALERQRSEKERLALEDQLRQSQKMEAIGRLAGGIAHDFNNLLTSIKGLSSLALSELEDDHHIRPDLEEIAKAAQRAAGLTRQLLAFSRKQRLKLVPVDLNAVVSGLEHMLRRVISERIELRATYAPALPHVMADPSQLEQVVMNLVVNAQDAMHEGGVIEMSTRMETLSEGRTSAPPGDYAVLSVSDTGAGIAPEDLDKVFEPFFTTKAAGEGTGLGLATVFGIVKQGGGYIDVDTEVGRGSTFRVYMPLAESDSDADAESEADEPSAGDADRGTEAVLVAEDDPSVRRLVRRVLERAGYEVLQAENADVASRLAADHPGTIHLLLTDVVMPHVSGQQLYERIRLLRPGVRVLYMSGYTENSIAGREAEDADAAFLAKPFPPHLLLARVRRVLDREPQTLMDR